MGHQFLLAFLAVVLICISFVFVWAIVPTIILLLYLLLNWISGLSFGGSFVLRYRLLFPLIAF